MMQNTSGCDFAASALSPCPGLVHASNNYKGKHYTVDRVSFAE